MGDTNILGVGLVLVTPTIGLQWGTYTLYSGGTYMLEGIINTQPTSDRVLGCSIDARSQPHINLRAGPVGLLASIHCLVRHPRLILGLLRVSILQPSTLSEVGCVFIIPSSI